MALINCIECGNKISDKAINCMSCGAPVALSLNQQNFKSKKINEAGAQNKATYAEWLEKKNKAINHIDEAKDIISTASSSNQEYLGIDGLYIHSPSRSFLKSISFCLKNYFTFSGRASRSEFWYFFLFNYLVFIPLQYLDLKIYEDNTVGLAFIGSLALISPLAAVSFRRLHDIDKSGWWFGGFCLAMVPITIGLIIFGAVIFIIENATLYLILVGFILILTIGYSILLTVFYCRKGLDKPNRYG